MPRAEKNIGGVGWMEESLEDHFEESVFDDGLEFGAGCFGLTAD